MKKVLGIKIDELSKEETLLKIEEFLKSTELHLVFTPNPEMVVKSASDRGFKEILNSSSLNLCDGFGLYIAARLRSIKVDRFTGVDFVIEACGLAERLGKKIYLLGSGREDVLLKTRENLSKKFPNLIVAGMSKGPSVIESPNALEISEDNQMILEEINSAAPDMIFVAFGMGKQEKWLMEYAKKLNSVRVGVGVGGAFDYLSGLTPRAPLLMQKFGLEWAYRLYKQPYRFKRIINATIAFSILFIRDIFHSGLNK